MEIGVQTFTIRKYQKKNLYKAIEKLINLGFLNFELARIKFNKTNAFIIKKLVDKYGIKISSIQAKPKDVFNHQQKLIEFCEIVGCKNIVISMLPFKCIFGNDNDFYEFIGTLDSYYDEYIKNNIVLAYHHHNWEYTKLINGKLMMDELLKKTSKIKIVHDTYWTYKSGRSSFEQIKKFKDRLLGIHLRDITFYKKGLKVLSKDTEIGNGIIDFKKFITKTINVEYMVIEQKTKTPYESLKKSYDYIKDNIYGER